MPVDFNLNIPSSIPTTDQQATKDAFRDDEADAARKAAEKKIAEKKEFFKSSTVHKEVDTRDNDVQQKMRLVLGGAEGPEAANALANWGNNSELQAKLTEAQKNLFREAMAKAPAQATKAGDALARLTQQPGFAKAVSTTQQAGTLQAGLLEHPAAEPEVAEALANRFMQAPAPKADPDTKNQFLRFAFDRAKDGNRDALKRTGDLLNSLGDADLGKLAQRSGHGMAKRKVGDKDALANLEDFVEQPAVRAMPRFARSKATELLAKADAKPEVKKGFEKLAGDAKFRGQTADNKGRFFSTIGTGRTSEYRPLTDKLLQSLQSSDFPSRAAQVSKFLTKVAGQVTRTGAKGVDTEAALKSAKKSALPSAPKLTSTVGLTDDELRQANSENRAKIIKFYNQVAHCYDDAEKKLKGASYFDDINRLQNLREAENIDTTGLSAEDQTFVANRQQTLNNRLGDLRTHQRDRMRELHHKRINPQKRRAKAEAIRIKGRQPKYFSPNVGRNTAASQAFLQAAVGGGQPQRLPGTPLRGQMAQRQSVLGGDDIEQHVAQAVAQLGSGPLTPQRAGQVAQVIANQVAQQVASQITAQLLGANTVAQTQVQNTPSPDSAPAPKGQQGKVDGWGIPRTFERDLGGGERFVVKAPAQRTANAELVVTESYTGKTIVKDPTTIRQLTELFSTGWKQLNKGEVAVLRNLGWSQQSWDTKDAPGAKWPVAMASAFINLNATQRESVRKLGITVHDWDQRVQAFTSGRNA